MARTGLSVARARRRWILSTMPQSAIHWWFLWVVVGVLVAKQAGNGIRTHVGNNRGTDCVRIQGRGCAAAVAAHLGWHLLARGLVSVTMSSRCEEATLMCAHISGHAPWSASDWGRVARCELGWCCPTGRCTYALNRLAHVRKSRSVYYIQYTVDRSHNR